MCLEYLLWLLLSMHKDLTRKVSGHGHGHSEVIVMHWAVFYVRDVNESSASLICICMFYIS